jgi:predicted transcriptional regulator YdeE
MEVLQQSEFAVVGIEARTSNAREMSPAGLIGRQWGRFMSEELLARIPHRTDFRILALYTDYESDEHGDYTFIIGAQVSQVGEIPPGMVVRYVPAGRYAKFVADDGPPEVVVPGAWKRIWEQPRTPEYARSYRADFEVYGDGAVNIFVGLLPL